MGILPKVVLAAIFTFMAVLECSGEDIKIMSYNIQHFGKREKLVDESFKLTKKLTTDGETLVKVQVTTCNMLLPSQ